MLTRNGYTEQALKQAENSPYKILLTDIHNLRKDLLNYPLQETKNILEQILKELEESKKRENKMYKAFGRLDRWVEKLKNQNSIQNNIFYFLLGFIASCISCILLLLLYSFL